MLIKLKYVKGLSKIHLILILTCLQGCAQFTKGDTPLLSTFIAFRQHTPNIVSGERFRKMIAELQIFLFLNHDYIIPN